MKCAYFERPGLDNLITDKDLETPSLTEENDVLIKVKMAGVNPIDYFIANGRHGIDSDKKEMGNGNALPPPSPPLPIKADPLPHIPGTEISGIVEKLGDRAKDDNHLKKGDRVVVYSRLFDGKCRQCLHGNEMLCRKGGGMVGLSTNGGFAEYVAVPSRNVSKIPDWMGWDLAASLPVAALTSFHALRTAKLSLNDWFVVMGASGNTGQFAIQFGKMAGAHVIAISKKAWVKSFLCADYHLTSYDNIVDEISYITDGKMADIVLNSLGSSQWKKSMDVLDDNGRIVTFGTLTGSDIMLDLRQVYTRQIKVIGSTAGKRSELTEIIESNSKNLKVKVWRKFRLAETRKALQALFFDKDRDGRILLSVED